LFSHPIFYLLAEVSSGDPKSDYLGVLLYTFGLILLFFLLMNVDRRFREYAGRSLVRPYNFFSDIRDRRLIPNAQTAVLSFICSGALGVFLATLIIGFNGHEAAGRYFTAFLPRSLYTTNAGSTLPYSALIIAGTAFGFAGSVLLAGLMRFAAMFIRGRYYFADAYNVTVWSLQPLAFLLVFDLLLPRLEMDHQTAEFSLLLLAAMILWCYSRILKGTGVLFDIYPTKIYGYGALLIALLVGIGYVFLQK
jgi:hypothetical protein